jgi:di/tricarboxylate transporter
MDEDYIHLWPAAMLTSALMLAFKCLNGDQARSSIDWEVYICIAFAFGVSTAMEKTKVALAIAQLFVRISEYPYMRIWFNIFLIVDQLLVLNPLSL